MATTFLPLNKSMEQPSSVCNSRRAVRNGRDELNHDLAIMRTMIDGDGSSIAQFDLVVQNYGYGGWVANNAVTDAMRTIAQESWNELNSVAAKLSAPGGQGDATGAAIDQACSKHGV